MWKGIINQSIVQKKEGGYFDAFCSVNKVYV